MNWAYMTFREMYMNGVKIGIKVGMDLILIFP